MVIEDSASGWISDDMAAFGRAQEAGGRRQEADNDRLVAVGRRCGG